MQTTVSVCFSFLLCQQKICLPCIHWCLNVQGCGSVEGRIEIEIKISLTCSPFGSWAVLPNWTLHFEQPCAEQSQEPATCKNNWKKQDKTSRSTALFTCPGIPLNPPNQEGVRWEMLNWSTCNCQFSRQHSSHATRWGCYPTIIPEAHFPAGPGKGQS